MTVAGDVRPDELLPWLEALFGALPQRPATALDARPIATPAEPVTDVLRMPGREQAIVAFGHRGVAWTHPDRYALEVVEAVISGSGGRLYQHIRERTGASYTLGAAHVPGEAGGYLFSYVATTPEQAEQVSQAVRDEWAALVQGPPSAEEIELAKRTLRDRYYSQLEEVGQVASQVAVHVLVGLGAGELERYAEAIARVTPEDVARVLRDYLGGAAVELHTLP